ncbi:hypothetical protein AQUCO_00900114v1 [Aquilegia coerulea]|uniref:Uncharacterized protein n=1 Tax=Aquilegia coerulea TaxID=218851 RepID=A0A2G5EC22_AQUCA|nr:hypothetical protein AQUCO_00900114v1 [Aquilegia coerulea]
MRGSIGRIASSNCTKQAFISSSSSSHFCTFSGGGGRGRGRGIGFTDLPKTEFNSQVPGKPVEENTQVQGEAKDATPPPGSGHGRGKPPITSNPILSSFSSMISGMNQSTGRGRTTQPSPSPSPPPPPPPISREPQSQSQSGQLRSKPIAFVQGDATEPLEKTRFRRLDQNTEEGSSLLLGMGRGKGVKGSSSDEKRPVEENRHTRKHRPKREEASFDKNSPRQPKMSGEAAAKKAMGILAKDGGRGRGGFREGEGTRGGRGGRGRGGTREGGGRTDGKFKDDDYDFGGLKLGSAADAADIERRLTERLGPEKMALLKEGFEEATDSLFPSRAHDAYLDAVDTNNMIEFEPEYLVEFDNPDIDEKPPIPLREALERMKPFLMVYEGIESQEEWEEIIDELMKNVPVMKELIDDYCGPDTVTAKQQQQELERVAKTLPENVPSSVKQFTDHAVLSLQVKCHPCTYVRFALVIFY